MPSASRPSRIVAKIEWAPPATAATAVPPASSARPLTVPIRALRRSSTTPDSRQDRPKTERSDGGHVTLTTHRSSRRHDRKHDSTGDRGEWDVGHRGGAPAGEGRLPGTADEPPGPA